MFQPNHFLPILNDRHGVKRKDSDESDFGWIKVTHKKSRKQSTLKSFLVTKNTRKASADEIQPLYFRPTQNSCPSQSQRQDNKATSVSPSTNDFHKGNKQTTSTSTSSNTSSYLPNILNKSDDLNTSTSSPNLSKKNSGQNGSTSVPKLSNKNCSQNTSVPNPLNKSGENASQYTSTSETGSSCKDTPLPKGDGLDTSTSASLCKDNMLDLPSSSYQKWITPPIGDLLHEPVNKFPATAYGRKKRAFQSSRR